MLDDARAGASEHIPINDMNLANLEQRRAKLSRGYDLITGHMRYAMGYGANADFSSRWRRLVSSIEYQFLPHYFGAVPGWRIRLRRLFGPRVLPDFCVVGPIKSGSSDLAVSLLLHPQVMTPLAKEFFVAAPDGWSIFYPTENEKKAHAERHGQALAPLVSPFLHSMELINNLHAIRPNAKIVITLRNPVERLVSHWKWEVFLAGMWRADSLPFMATFASFVDKALDAYPDFPMFTACECPALQNSLYWKAVGYWIEKFGKENVIVVDVADYFKDRSSLLRTIQEFIGLPFVDVPQSKTRVNENPVELPPPDAESIAKLKEFFEPHNQKLWQLIGKKFDW